MPLLAVVADEPAVPGGAVVRPAAVGTDADGLSHGAALSIGVRAAPVPDIHIAAVGDAGRVFGKAAGDDGEGFAALQFHERLQADAEGDAAALRSGNGERVVSGRERHRRLKRRGDALKGGDALGVRARRAAQKGHGLRAIARAYERITVSAIFFLAGDEHIALSGRKGLRAYKDGRRAVRAADDGLGKRRAAQRQQQHKTDTEQFFHHFSTSNGSPTTFWHIALMYI